MIESAQDVFEVSVLIMDGEPRIICNDCGHRLAAAGLTGAVAYGEVSGMKVTVYEIEAPFTVEDCKLFVTLEYGPS